MISFETLQYFHFIRPYVFLMLIPVALLTYFQWRRVDLVTQWKPYIAEHLLSEMVVAGNNRKFVSPFWMLPILGVLIVFALAGPSWDRNASPFAEDNAALVIALDLSPSMDQGDIAPSRLLRAKVKITELLEKRGDAYTALVVYSGTAHTVIHLSNDRDVLHHYLDSLKVGMLPSDGKSPENVLPVARELLKQQGAPGTILFLTDGATEHSVNFFKDFFDRSIHQLIVWGIGKTQTEINDSEVAGFETSIVAMQESLLLDIVDAGQGKYQPLTVDDEDIQEIYKNINRAYLAGDDETRPWIDQGYWLILPIMLIFLQWFRKGWTLEW